MLPDRLSRLLTGFVDGQLSSSEQKQALELLRRSPEARELLQRLQADAQMLAAFPRAQLPTDFNEQLQTRLPARSLKVAAFSRNTERRFTLRHAAIYVAAATLLIALGIAYVQKSRPTIEAGSPIEAHVRKEPGDNDTTSTLIAELLPSPRPESMQPSTSTPAASGIAVVRPEVLANMPRPEANVSTAPFASIEPLRVPDPKVPLILAMREIDQPKGQGRLAEELALANLWRLDLSCQESEVATTRLKHALHDQGINLLIDPDAANRQRLHFAKTSYAVLAENMSQAECLGLVKGLRKVDREEQARSRSNNQFIEVKLARWSPEDGRHLEDLFGFKAAFRDATKSVPAEVNSRDAGVMAAARAAAIWREQNPEGQGSARHAFLVADNVGRVRKPSNENQLFLNSRQPPRPDRLQLMIVLTPRKG